MSDNCVKVTEKLLKSLNIKHTKKYLKDNILSHVDYPSLLCISDTLKKYKISTLPVKINVNKLNQIPTPCIVQIKDDGEYFFCVLKSVIQDNITYYDNKSKIKVISKKSFLEIWSGICLLVEKTELSKEIDIKKKIASKLKQNVLRGTISFMLICWIIITLITNQGINDESLIFNITYIVIKLTGLTVSTFLLWFEVDKHNPVLQNFCVGTNKKINCNVVLNSKYAKIFKSNISLSLLSFAYFFATILYLLIYRFNPTSVSLVGILSLACIPIILVSFYYEAFVIKQWCKFCIMIQLILFTESFIVFFNKPYINPIEFETFSLLIALLLTPILIWEYLKPLLEEEKKLNIYKRDLRKIKNNPLVFESLLSKSRKISNSTEGLGISLKNSNIKYNVIKVCNPYCSPCAQAHPILENLLEDGKINLQMIFTAKADGKDFKAKPVSHFLAIDSMGDEIKTKQALNFWYRNNTNDYKMFYDQYPLKGEIKQHHDKIQAMRDWCDAENITHTPTVFINGFELPKEYSIKDLIEVLN